MDMLFADLTDIPEADIGSPVELWGQQVAVDDVARAADTIGYELLCAVTRRVPMRWPRQKVLNPGIRCQHGKTPRRHPGPGPEQGSEEPPIHLAQLQTCSADAGIVQGIIT